MYKLLNVSTKHISKETANFLAEQGLKAANDEPTEIHAGSHPFGWFVYCHDDELDQYPSDLSNLLIWARKVHGAEYINLDCDGEEHDITEYDW